MTANPIRVATPAPSAPLRELTASAQARLSAVSESPRLDAALLLAHALGVPRSWLLAHPEHRPDDAAVERFQALVGRRERGEPVAYLLGEQEFWSLRLRVTADVLVPRADTETLVEQALSVIPADTPSRVADLGTGSGAVALAIASERPRARITASDASERALAVAAANARRLRLTNVSLVHGHWFAPLAGLRFDCIVSNPPYIPAGDTHLTRGGLAFEPRVALVAPDQGLADLRHLVHHAPAHLAPAGWLMLEHGHDQGAAVRTLMRDRGYTDVTTVADLAGNDRVTRARWSGQGNGR